MSSDFGFDDDFSDFSSGATSFSSHDNNLGADFQPPKSGYYIPPAQECMRCGQCLAHCPTYQTYNIEEESPRGRLRIIERLLEQEEPIDTTTEEHLLNCLQCRSCESACPSKVQYGALFDKTTRHLRSLESQTEHKPALAEQLSEKLLSMINAGGFKKTLHLSLRAYQKTGLQALVRKSGLLKPLRLSEPEALLPELEAPLSHSRYATQGNKKGTVGLFTGCLASVVDNKTLKDSVKVLNTLGYEVLVPQNQVCCGALHQHLGYAEPAAAMARQNITVFNDLNVDAVIYVASACGQRLSESETSHADSASTRKTAGSFKKKLHEIAEFLTNQEWPESIQLTPSTEKVAVHEPCSQRNPTPKQASTYQLLAKIPGMTVVSAPENELCCGAGGSHMLTHPELAQSLRQRKLDKLESDVSILVSSNIGCAMHLAAGLRNDHPQRSIQVLHPISLIARQIND